MTTKCILQKTSDLRGNRNSELFDQKSLSTCLVQEKDYERLNNLILLLNYSTRSKYAFGRQFSVFISSNHLTVFG